MKQLFIHTTTDEKWDYSEKLLASYQVSSISCFQGSQASFECFSKVKVKALSRVNCSFIGSLCSKNTVNM